MNLDLSGDSVVYYPLRGRSVVAGVEFVAMTEAEVNRVVRLVSKGAKLLVGRNHSGRQKIKIVYGPFGLIKERYVCEHSDFERIRQLLGHTKEGLAVH